MLRHSLLQCLDTACSKLAQNSSAPRKLNARAKPQPTFLTFPKSSCLRFCWNTWNFWLQTLHSKISRNLSAPKAMGEYPTPQSIFPKPSWERVPEEHGTPASKPHWIITQSSCTPRKDACTPYAQASIPQTKLKTGAWRNLALLVPNPVEQLPKNLTPQEKYVMPQALANVP